MLNPSSLLKKLPVFFFFYLIASLASAQVYNSSISAATGGTGRASIEAGDVSFLNPAGLMHLRGRHFFMSGTNSDEYALALSDNNPEIMFPMALGFVSQKEDISLGKVNQQDMTLSIADFVAGPVSIGMTGHYVQQKMQTGPAAWQQTNGDLGVLYTPANNFGVGAVLYNIFGTNKSVPSDLQQKEKLGLGCNYIYQTYVRFRVDTTTLQENSLGMESFLNRFMVIRMGFENDNEESRNLVTGGLGFKGPRFAVNYAYQGNIKVSSDYRHSIDLEVPF
jgi:hypothetical protein